MISGVIIPDKMTPELAEETGIHTGDGSMNHYRNIYMYSLRGHKTDDKRYFIDFLKPLYKRLFNLDVNIRENSDTIGFQKCSTELVVFKHVVMGLPLGPKEEISIPDEIFGDKKYLACFIRGLFDTDGCVYLEDKSNGPYPRIEIHTTSKILSTQIKDGLNKLGFSVSCWTIVYKGRSWKNGYKICTRGFSSVEKWLEMIGTNNPRNQDKFDFITRMAPVTS
jgi:hypothetical protein